LIHWSPRRFQRTAVGFDFAICGSRYPASQEENKVGYRQRPHFGVHRPPSDALTTTKSLICSPSRADSTPTRNAAGSPTAESLSAGRCAGNCTTSQPASQPRAKDRLWNRTALLRLPPASRTSPPRLAEAGPPYLQPRSALLALRLALESLMRLVYADLMQREPGHLTMYDIEHEIDAAGLIPREVKGHLDTARASCNMATHDPSARIPAADADLVFAHASRVADWAIKTLTAE